MLKTAIVAAALVCALQQDEKLDNPAYKGWAKLKPGSWVTYKTETDGGGKTQTSETTATLKSVDDDVAVVENKTSYMSGDQKKEFTQEQKQKAKISKADMGTITKEGEEEIEVNGKTLKCRVVDLEKQIGGAKLTFRFWLSEEIPGGAAKMEGGGPNGRVKLTVTGWEKK